jgi:hypothetical protein
MTVAELIEELQRFPAHHRVFVNHDTTPPFSPGPSSDWAPVYEVRADEQCTVIIDAEPSR